MYSNTGRLQICCWAQISVRSTAGIIESTCNDLFYYFALNVPLRTNEGLSGTPTGPGSSPGHVEGCDPPTIEHTVAFLPRKIEFDSHRRPDAVRSGSPEVFDFVLISPSHPLCWTFELTSKTFLSQFFCQPELWYLTLIRANRKKAEGKKFGGNSEIQRS